MKPSHGCEVPIIFIDSLHDLLLFPAKGLFAERCHRINTFQTTSTSSHYSRATRRASFPLTLVQSPQAVLLPTSYTPEYPWFTHRSSYLGRCLEVGIPEWLCWGRNWRWDSWRIGIDGSVRWVIFFNGGRRGGGRRRGQHLAGGGSRCRVGYEEGGGEC